jgi:predicted RNA-binding Zn-ribbon protein involved in translation (DUF1610 family)
MERSDEGQIDRRIVGLNCPACGGTLDLREGATIELCPFCGTPLLLNIPGNVPSYSAVRHLDETEAWLVVERWLLSRLEERASWRITSRCLPSLFEDAQMEEALLVYAPFWVVTGQAIGLLPGADRQPADHPVLSVHPAYDVSELPVQDILLGHDVVMPLDRDTLIRDGMVLKARVPPEKATAMAKQRALGRLWGTARVGAVDIVGLRQVLLFYPLWVIRYRYWGRCYRAVVDGTEPRLLSGQMSDRLPKLVILVGVLGLLASFFGMAGFLGAGLIAHGLAPKLLGAGPAEEQPGPQLDTRWGEIDKTRAVPLLEAGSAKETRVARQSRIVGEGPWLIPLRCPACGQALSGGKDAALFYCETCQCGVEYREGGLRPVEVTFVEAEEGGDVPHPWWILTVRGLRREHGSPDWVPCPGEGTLDVYVPASRLPLSDCLAQGVYLTRRRPRLTACPEPSRRACPEPSRRAVQSGVWGTCTVSREDALRLARLIYSLLDDDLARLGRRLELISAQLVVFMSD